MLKCDKEARLERQPKLLPSAKISLECLLKQTLCQVLCDMKAIFSCLRLDKIANKVFYVHAIFKE